MGILWLLLVCSLLIHCERAVISEGDGAGRQLQADGQEPLTIVTTDQLARMNWLRQAVSRVNTNQTEAFGFVCPEGFRVGIRWVEGWLTVPKEPGFVGGPVRPDILALVGPNTGETVPLAAMSHLPVANVAQTVSSSSVGGLENVVRLPIPSLELEGRALVRLIRFFGWRRFVLLFSDSGYGLALASAIRGAAVDRPSESEGPLWVAREIQISAGQAGTQQQGVGASADALRLQNALSEAVDPSGGDTTIFVVATEQDTLIQVGSAAKAAGLLDRQGVAWVLSGEAAGVFTMFNEASSELRELGRDFEGALGLLPATGRSAWGAEGGEGLIAWADSAAVREFVGERVGVSASRVVPQDVIAYDATLLLSAGICRAWGEMRNCTESGLCGGVEVEEGVEVEVHSRGGKGTGARGAVARREENDKVPSRDSVLHSIRETSIEGFSGNVSGVEEGEVDNGFLVFNRRRDGWEHVATLPSAAETAAGAPEVAWVWGNLSLPNGTVAEVFGNMSLAFSGGSVEIPSDCECLEDAEDESGTSRPVCRLGLLSIGSESPLAGVADAVREAVAVLNRGGREFFDSDLDSDSNGVDASVAGAPTGTSPVLFELVEERLASPLLRGNPSKTVQAAWKLLGRLEEPEEMSGGELEGVEEGNSTDRVNSTDDGNKTDSSSTGETTRVSGLLGPWDSESFSLSAPLFLSEGVPVVSLADATAVLGDFKGPSLISVGPPPDKQAGALVKFMLQLGWRQFVVVHSDDGYGKALAGSLHRAALRASVPWNSTCVTKPKRCRMTLMDSILVGPRLSVVEVSDQLRRLTGSAESLDASIFVLAVSSEEDLEKVVNASISTELRETTGVAWLLSDISTLWAMKAAAAAGPTSAGAEDPPDPASGGARPRGGEPGPLEVLTGFLGLLPGWQGMARTRQSGLSWPTAFSPRDGSLWNRLNLLGPLTSLALLLFDYTLLVGRAIQNVVAGDPELSGRAGEVIAVDPEVLVAEIQKTKVRGLTKVLAEGVGGGAEEWPFLVMNFRNRSWEHVGFVSDSEGISGVRLWSGSSSAERGGGRPGTDEEMRATIRDQRRGIGVLMTDEHEGETNILDEIRYPWEKGETAKDVGAGLLECAAGDAESCLPHR